MPKVVASEQQRRILDFDRSTTMRVYATAADKRAVVVKEDDLLTEPDIQVNPVKASKALYTEHKTWFDKACFKVRDISNMSNIMTSMRANKRKFVKVEKGEMKRTNGLRPVLWGFVDLEAFDVETFSGAEWRSSKRLVDSAAACAKQWIIASPDIDMAFLKGQTSQGLAEAAGGKARVARFAWPPGSAPALRSAPGVVHCDASRH
eukprot:1794024-Pyramimonas_sp.AAC.1